MRARRAAMWMSALTLAPRALSRAQILRESGSIELAKARASVLVKEAWAAVDPLLKESEAKALLKAFADYLIDRKS